MAMQALVLVVVAWSITFVQSVSQRVVRTLCAQRALCFDGALVNRPKRGDASWMTRESQLDHRLGLEVMVGPCRVGHPPSLASGMSLLGTTRPTSSIARPIYTLNRRTSSFRVPSCSGGGQRTVLLDCPALRNRLHLLSYGIGLCIPCAECRSAPPKGPDKALYTKQQPDAFAWLIMSAQDTPHQPTLSL